MKGRNLLLLLAALIVLSGLAYRARHRGYERPVSADSGKIIFPDMDINAVEKIRFGLPAGDMVFEKADGIWVATDRFGYPVKFENVVDLVKTVANMKVGQVIPAEKSQMASLQLVPPDSDPAPAPGTSATRVTMQDGAGRTVVELLLGKKHGSASRDETGAPIPGQFDGPADGRYIYAHGKVYLVSDTFSIVPQRVKDWIKDDIVTLYSGDVVEVIVEGGKDREPIRLTRQEGGAMALGAMELDGLEEGRELDPSEVEGLVGALSYLRFDDIADPSTDPEELGFQEGVTYRARTRQGMIYTVNIGGDTATRISRYLRISVSCEAPLAEDPDESDAEAEEVAGTQAEEAARLDAELGKWIYIVRDYTAGQFMIERQQLIYPKEEIVTNPE